MKFGVVFLVVVGLLLGTAGIAISQGSCDVKAGKMQVGFRNGGDGFSIRYNGVPVVTDSTIWLHNPSWTKHYYHYGLAGKDIQVNEIKEGKEIIIQHKSDEFDGQHKITVYDNKVIFQLDYALTKDIKDADLEYCFGKLSASLMTGKSYDAVMIGGEPFHSMVPIRASFPETAKSLYTPKSFQKISFETRVGKLTIESKEISLDLFDARKNPYDWAKKYPVLWCGNLGQHLEYGKKYSQTVTLSIDPLPARQRPKAEAAGGAVKAADSGELRVPASGPVVVIPEPQEMSLLGDDFKITSQTRMIVAQNATEADLRGAYSFAEELKALYGVSIPILRESKAAKVKSRIIVGEAAKSKLIKKTAAALEISAPAKKEGYGLVATANTVLVLGHDQQGSYYGMQTLKQLVKASAHGISIQGCRISDYPSLPLRGVHIFLGDKALPFHKKMIDRILARYKMNLIVYEIGDLKWDSDSKTWVPFSMSKEDLRADLQYAHNHFMETVPLLQSLGHCDWMFNNKANLNLAEDPNNPYGYCASKPETYNYVYQFYDEAMELFKPKYFHIGHDEVVATGGFQKDEACKQKEMGELFIDDIKKIRDHIRSKKSDVQVMMWGDMLLANGDSPDATNAPDAKEAKRRRDMLPRDTIIIDWHYDASQPDRFKSAKIFTQEGFKTIGATWYTPANIANFSKALKDNKCMGLLQTTWAGFNSNETNLKDSFIQFSAFILAAEYGWNSGKTALDDLPYRADEEFNKQWYRAPADRTPRKGFTVDISSLYNVTLADNLEQTGWLGLGKSLDLSEAPKGTVRLKGDLFKLAESTLDPSAVRLSSALDSEIAYPNEVVIPVSKKAASLVFLQTTAWPAVVNQQVGSYLIEYVDGSHEEAKLVYGDNIASWLDRRLCKNGPDVWNGHTQGGEKTFLRKFEWQNPKPDQVITQIKFQSTNSESGPVLLGISGITVE